MDDLREKQKQMYLLLEEHHIYFVNPEIADLSTTFSALAYKLCINWLFENCFKLKMIFTKNLNGGAG